MEILPPPRTSFSVLTIILLGVMVIGCTEEVDLYQEGEPTPVVYCLMALLGSCDSEETLPNNGTDGMDTWKGAVEFDFEVPQTGVPAKGVRRVLLDVAQSADSLNRKDFYSAANVSDFNQKIKFQ